MHKVYRHYQRFTGQERFELFLDAMARGDEEEAAALGQSCPTFNYRQNDLEFQNRIQAHREVMMVVYLEITKHLAVLRLIQPAEKIAENLASDLAMCAFDSAIEAHWNAVEPGVGPESRELGDPRAPCLNKLMSGSAGNAQELKKSLSAMWDVPRDHALGGMARWLAGLDQFATQHWGISGQQAMNTMFDLFDDLEPFMDQIATFSLDAVEADNCYQMLTALWESMLKNIFPLPR